MKKIALLCFLIPAVALFAKSKDEYLNDLKSSDDATAIAAAQYLGNDGAKDAIEPLGELLKSNRSAGVRIAAAAALGRMDTKGRPTTLLREAIEADQDNQVVYTELLALLNLKDLDNADLTRAVEFAEQNKSSDFFIGDIIARIRKVVPKKEEAPKAEEKPAEATP